MSTEAQNARQAGALLSALVAGGVAELVLSPGSRSTPLVLAADSLSALRVHDVLDERVAGFFALGLARASGRPVALLCTSGSAGAHYLPAVIEASQSRVPLVILTADRPVELQGCGAPQTVDQRGFFEGFLRMDASLGESSPNERWIGGLAARALDAATGAVPGPVRINAPFREPLWSPGVESAGAFPEAPRVVRGPPGLDEATLDALAERIRGVQRGIFVVGPREMAWEGARWGKAGARLAPALFALAERLGWPVLADAASGLRFGPPHPLRIGGFDALLRGERRSLVPDGVMRFGQLPTSKPLFGWLARVAVGRTVLVDPTAAWHDPDHTASLLLAAEPTALCEALLQRLGEARPDPSWAQRWTRAEAITQRTLSAASEASFWAGGVARALSESLPEGALLHVASSMPVRDFDTFAASNRAFSVSVNRGANGIDGTLATALGAARSRSPVVALCGDLAFQHDLGALAMARELSAPVVCLVVDNGGGGIFGFLPIAQHKAAFEKHFLTPQGLDILACARAFGLHAERCEGLSALRGALSAALARPGFTLLHLPIDRVEDLQRHRDTWAKLDEALGDV